MRRTTTTLCAAGAALAFTVLAATPQAGAAVATATSALAASTSADLDAAMHGEAFAWAKYTLFGEQARAEGRTAAAALWASTAKVERGEHFAEEGELLGIPGSDVANLQAAIAGENYETTTMYPGFAADAARTGDTELANLFTEIAADEAKHRDAYIQALTVITTGVGSIPAPWTADVYPVTPGRPTAHGQNLKNLLSAMHGEATASVKYDMYAATAAQGGNGALAALFGSTSQIEFREHFSEEAQNAGLVGDTAANLKNSAMGENAEATHMYPNMARQAWRAGDVTAGNLFWEISFDEARHRDAFLAELGR